MRKQYTDEQKATFKAEAAQRKEAVDATIASICDAILTGDDSAMVAYLEQADKFHRYSFYNTCLILMQCPDATMVNSFKRWADLGRRVKAGAKSIRILAPITFKEKDEEGEVVEDGKSFTTFREVPVFDLSQTEGEPLKHWMPELHDFSEVLEGTLTFAKSAGYKVVDAPRFGFAAGCINTDKGITINTTTPEACKVLTLWHELAHGELEHINAKGNELAANLKEGEAEVTMAVVASHFGFDVIDASAGYLRQWEVKPSDVKRSLERIKKAAGRIIEGVEAVLLGEVEEEVA